MRFLIGPYDRGIGRKKTVTIKKMPPCRFERQTSPLVKAIAYFLLVGCYSQLNYRGG